MDEFPRMGIWSTKVEAQEEVQPHPLAGAPSIAVPGATDSHAERDQ